MFVRRRRYVLEPLQLWLEDATPGYFCWLAVQAYSPSCLKQGMDGVVKPLLSLSSILLKRRPNILPPYRPLHLGLFTQ